MTRRHGAGRPHVEPLSDAAWTRIERALWRRWAAAGDAPRLDPGAPSGATAGAINGPGLLRRVHRRCSGGGTLL